MGKVDKILYQKQNTKKKWLGNVTPAVKCLPSMCAAMSSIPSTAKKEKSRA
jgi:hypothetical protein